ncbi:carbohydrate ABC transporter permease [Paenibacillus sp. FSL H8-0457]|uniref:carbohydrate ABC transporter permease n=1 Tax=Bacillales TaxID=1385 RepID=UPI0001789144|nr:MULTISPECIES: carbohydrate ABC transporter permease [Paenibacillus]ACX68162.1 binding-protein-dependent transport systems inner membrane component [Paenibacillus sp. Y412MC10]ETT65060.1 binding-protein-dependent transport systems inner membrane component [Paenibacillus sp. FSL H8-457]MCM3261444.1 carbohydrate ABC transporter permease [Paenibacillus lautus]
MLKRLSFSDRMMLVIIYSLLSLLAFSAFYPFWNAIVVSFNVGVDTAKGGITFWPREFTLQNYEIILGDSRLLNGFAVSISRAVIGTVASIFMTALLAYGMTRTYLIGRGFYMVFFVFTMYFGGGLIPTYLLIRSLGLMDSFLVFIIPSLISVWNMIIFRTFFKGLPNGLEESAHIDGCSTWGIFFRIILPLSGPVIATLALLTAVAHWNDWFLPSIYITNGNLMPIQTILRETLNANIVSEQTALLDTSSIALMEKTKQITSKSLQMAIMIVVTMPIIMVYPFLQKYFVKGVLVGSLKE